MLQDLHVEILRLIDDQHRVLSSLPLFQQEPVQFINEFFLGVSFGIDPEILIDTLEQFPCGQGRVEDEGHHCVRVQVIQKGAAECCLAGADLPCNDNEPATLPNPVDQVSKSLLVGLAKIEILRIRRYGKRLFLDSVKFAVHFSISISCFFRVKGMFRTQHHLIN